MLNRAAVLATIRLPQVPLCSRPCYPEETFKRRTRLRPPPRSPSRKGLSWPVEKQLDDVKRWTAIRAAAGPYAQCPIEDKPSCGQQKADRSAGQLRETDQKVAVHVVQPFEYRSFMVSCRSSVQDTGCSCVHVFSQALGPEDAKHGNDFHGEKEDYGGRPQVICVSVNHPTRHPSCNLHWEENSSFVVPHGLLQSLDVPEVHGRWISVP